jgi:hypothetical protein
MSFLHPIADPGGDKGLVESADSGRGTRPPRTNLFLGALMEVPNKPAREVRVRNLSTSGARINCSDPPGRGTTLLLYRGSAVAAAEVVWADEGSCGLLFAEPIDVERWISDRARAAPVRAEPSLADDLALARRLLERLEDELAAEPIVVAAMGDELQALDIWAQLLRTAETRAGGSSPPASRGVRQAAATFLGRSVG